MGIISIVRIPIVVFLEHWRVDVHNPGRYQHLYLHRMQYNLPYHGPAQVVYRV